MCRVCRAFLVPSNESNCRYDVQRCHSLAERVPQDFPTAVPGLALAGTRLGGALVVHESHAAGLHAFLRAVRRHLTRFV